MPKPDISVEITTQIVVTIGPDEKKAREGILGGIRKMCNDLPEGQRPGIHEEKAGDFTRILLNVSNLPETDPDDLREIVKAIVNEELMKDPSYTSGNESGKYSSLTLKTDQ